MEKKHTILLVDDDKDYLFQMKFHLEKAGFIVRDCDNQKDAESFISTGDFNLALLDLMMENDDTGFILSRLIKKQWPVKPVIIATAIANETGMSFNIEAEQGNPMIMADRYIEKGIRPDQLIILIKSLIK